jgi:hypothetical protein
LRGAPLAASVAPATTALLRGALENPTSPKIVRLTDVSAGGIDAAHLDEFAARLADDRLAGEIIISNNAED